MNEEMARKADLVASYLRSGDMRGARIALDLLTQALQPDLCQVCGEGEAPYTVCREHFWKAAEKALADQRGGNSS